MTESNMATSRGWRVPARRVVSIIFVLIGAALLFLGIELVMVSGSPYFALAGVATVVSGAWLWRGDRRGAWTYAGLLIVTVIWALWDAGPHAWALTSRVVAPGVLGLLLLLPFVYDRGNDARSGRGRALVTVAVLLPFAVVLAVGLSPDKAANPWSNPLLPIPASAGDGREWASYGGDPAGHRFSPLESINPGNVGSLEKVWQFRTGFVKRAVIGNFESTPLKIGDSLFLCTGNNEIISLDAETGEQRWRFDSRMDAAGVYQSTCRGVSYYKDPAAPADAPCAERILFATLDSRLMALDKRTGQLCAGFGEGGKVNLLEGMGPVVKGYYSVTSAPQVIRGKVVLGGYVHDNQNVDSPSGVVRAFDAVTGKFAWAFDAGRPGDPSMPKPGERFTPGTPNSWAPMSADEALGMVYVPTGNAAPDWYGGERRPFDDKYSSAVVAINADTGAVVWSFNTVNHDLWDYDVGSQPTLYDMPMGNTRVPALIQATKRGEIFVLDRRTGKPLLPVEQRKVPASTVPGERAAPTQPFSVGMPSFAQPLLTESQMWGLTPLDQAWCRIQFRKARYEGIMTPFSVGTPSISAPSYIGGMDWGSVSIDRTRDIMIVNLNNAANYGMLIPRAQANKEGLQPMSPTVKGDPSGGAAQAGTPYGLHIGLFMSPLEVPCTEPPFGKIAAIDMKTRKVLWEKPFGTARDTGPWGMRSGLPFDIGVFNMGGSVVTASGLVFIAATADRHFRAYDIRTGKELWRTNLPAGGQATPMTYLSPRTNRQMVVLSAGGQDGLRSVAGDYVMAFALPTKK